MIRDETDEHHRFVEWFESRRAGASAPATTLRGTLRAVCCARSVTCRHRLRRFRARLRGSCRAFRSRRGLLHLLDLRGLLDLRNLLDARDLLDALDLLD